MGIIKGDLLALFADDSNDDETWPVLVKKTKGRTRHPPVSISVMLSDPQRLCLCQQATATLDMLKRLYYGDFFA